MDLYERKKKKNSFLSKSLHSTSLTFPKKEPSVNLPVHRVGPGASGLDASHNVASQGVVFLRSERAMLHDESKWLKNQNTPLNELRML